MEKLLCECGKDAVGNSTPPYFHGLDEERFELAVWLCDSWLCETCNEERFDNYRDEELDF